MSKGILVYNNCSCGSECEHYGKPHYSNDDGSPYLDKSLDYWLTTKGLKKDLETGTTTIVSILRRTAYHHIIANDNLLEGL